MEAVNVILMNPTLYQSHGDVYRAIAGTMDSASGLVVRCLECFRQRT